MDTRLSTVTIRVSNLEESRSSSVDSTIMIRDRVYRNRKDVQADVRRWFSEECGNKIDASLFMTPHYMLNLIHADMCSKEGPKTPLDHKDLLKVQIRRADADAFFALKSDKPEFMVTRDTIPNFTYHSTKSQREAASIKFLPSFEDFGNDSDADSIYYKFKSSLESIKQSKDKYIESKLAGHPDNHLEPIARQLLHDSSKFILQM